MALHVVRMSLLTGISRHVICAPMKEGSPDWQCTVVEGLHKLLWIELPVVCYQLRKWEPCKSGQFLLIKIQPCSKLRSQGSSVSWENSATSSLGFLERACENSLKEASSVFWSLINGLATTPPEAPDTKHLFSLSFSWQNWLPRGQITEPPVTSTALHSELSPQASCCYFNIKSLCIR